MALVAKNERLSISSRCAHSEVVLHMSQMSVEVEMICHVIVGIRMLYSCVTSLNGFQKVSQRSLSCHSYAHRKSLIMTSMRRQLRYVCQIVQTILVSSRLKTTWPSLRHMLPRLQDRMTTTFVA